MQYHVRPCGFEWILYTLDYKGREDVCYRGKWEEVMRQLQELKLQAI